MITVIKLTQTKLFLFLLGDKRDLDSYTGCIPQHMLHLLPVTPKSSALASCALQGSCLNTLGSKAAEAADTGAELSQILQQYSTLQAAAGLANNENAKTLFGGLDPSALLQLQLLQVFQHKNFKHNELLKPLQVSFGL